MKKKQECFENHNTKTERVFKRRRQVAEGRNEREEDIRRDE